MRDLGFSLDLRGWEDTLPGVGRPQERINGDVDSCDLFIGLVWKRWGQPTGTHASGFEEECERALARHAATGSPEIWVFFKEVDKDTRADPGLQLQKVLDFREHAERERRFFYSTFGTTADWERKIRNRLSRFVLSRHLATREIEGTPSTSRTRADDAGARSPLADVQSVNALLSEVASKGVACVEDMPEERQQYLVARLHLLSAALSDLAMGQDDLRTHDINALFRYREQLGGLDPRERLAVLRLILHGRDVDPVYAFLWRDDVDVWRKALIYTFSTSHDTRTRLRSRAIDLLADLKTVPGDFPRVRDAVLADDGGAVRDAGIRWISLAGTAEDAQSMLDSNVASDAKRRDAVITAAVTAMARKDMSSAYDLALDGNGMPDESALSALADRSLSLTEEQIARSLTHSAPTLRLFALTQLLSRGRLSDAEVTARQADSDLRVRLLAFGEAIERGFAVTAKQIEESFEDGLPQHRDEKRDLTQRLMRRSSDDELKERIRIIGPGGPQAYRELSLRPGGGIDLGEDLGDGGSPLRERLLNTERERSEATFDLLMGEHKNLIGYMLRDYCQAGLDAFAQRGEASNLGIVEPYLTSEDSLTRYLALEAYEALGGPEHVQVVLRLTNDGREVIAQKAVCVAMHLTDDLGYVVEQIGEDASAMVHKSALAVLCGAQYAGLEVLVNRRLRHTGADVRVAAVAALVRNSTDEALCAYLAEYLSASPYFYNVPTLLDRVLFAPASLREHYRETLLADLSRCREPTRPTW